MRADSYSRMVGLLKVALPLLALGILSTLFLISRAVDPPATVPFADTEVQQRLTNQQVTGPYFSGTTRDGDEIALVAETVTTPDGRVGANRATNVDVQIDLTGGRRVTITALEADVDVANDRTDLFGEVEVTTSGGYIMQSEELSMVLSRLDMISPGSVFVTGPLGDIEAGAMRLATPRGQSGSELHFTDGVKLLYTPDTAD